MDYRIKKPTTIENLALDIAAALDDHIEFHEGEEILDLTITPATPGQRAVYACYWYQYEVCNGGHHQFFNNSTGILWEEAIRGFNLLKNPPYKAILEDAVSLFPNRYPSKDRQKRMEQLSAIPKEQLKELDTKLYELDEIEDFDKIFIPYINVHPDEFFIL